MCILCNTFVEGKPSNFETLPTTAPTQRVCEVDIRYCFYMHCFIENVYGLTFHVFVSKNKFKHFSCIHFKPFSCIILSTMVLIMKQFIASQISFLFPEIMEIEIRNCFQLTNIHLGSYISDLNNSSHGFQMFYNHIRFGKDGTESYTHEAQ